MILLILLGFILLIACFLCFMFKEISELSEPTINLENDFKNGIVKGATYRVTPEDPVIVYYKGGFGPNYLNPLFRKKFFENIEKFDKLYNSDEFQKANKLGKYKNK